MEINDLLFHRSTWLSADTPRTAAVSSRGRLARNIDGFPFAQCSNPEQRRKMMEMVRNVLEKTGWLIKGGFFELDKLSELDRLFLMERHLISKDHALDEGERAVFIDNDEVVSVMVNEEDHLRIQVIHPGFQLKNVWETINSIDDHIESGINYSFVSELGYLTACPTNTGTGLRASVMLHLPALFLANQIGKILNSITHLGLTIRGFYGEGTELRSAFFQISNRITLGQTEEELIDNIERITGQVVEHENNARDNLMKNSRAKVEDSIWRALGILRNARLISYEEALEHLSSLRLGIEMGIVKDIKLPAVTELFILTQPAHIQKLAGRKMEAAERDEKRAALIRERIGRREEKDV